MKKQISTIVTYLLFFLIGVISFGPLDANAVDQGDVEITMITAPFFAQDHNQCDLVPGAAYIGLKVTNISGVQLTNLEVTLNPTTIGYSLANGQPGTLPVGTLDDGDSFVAYYYIDFPCSTTTTGMFDISVSDGSGGAHTEQIAIDNVPVLEVGMSSIDSVLLEGGETTADPLYLTVYYDFGTVKKFDKFSFQPAGNPDFEAGAYQLTTTEVIFSELVAVPENTVDLLYFEADAKQNGNDIQVAIKYTFDVKVPEVSTYFFPYATHWSGPQHNYSNDYGDVTSGMPFSGATPIPDIHIEKYTNGISADSVPGPIVVPGSTITWTYVVTNPGETPLTGVDLVDDNGTPDTGDDFSPAFDAGDLDGDGFLDLGETWTFTYTGTAIGGQYGNVGFTLGVDALGDTVTAMDESHYFGSMPAIDVELHTNGEDADNPTGPSLIVGTEVIWTYMVTNIGNIALTAVEVTDNNGTPGLPSDDFLATYLSGDDGNGILDVGETWIFQETGTVMEGQYANQATATASEPSAQTFSDRDNSHYIGLPPAIHVEKTTNGADADAAPGPYVPIGERILWVYTVTNASGEPLSNITIIDDHSTLDPSDDFVPEFISGDENGDNILDVSEVWIYRKRGFSLLPGQYGNKVTVSGTMPDQQVLFDSEMSHFWGTAASLYIETLTNNEDADTAVGPYLNVGDQVNWTYTVTNNGNVDLTQVVIVDDNGTTRNPSDDFYPVYVSGDDGDDTLQIGETWVFEATGTAKTGQYGNWGSVQAMSPANRLVYDTDKSHYFGVITTLGLDVLTNGTESDSPSGPQIEEGDEVEWTYYVTLEGNSYLDRVSLIDDNGTPKDPADDFTPVFVSGDDNKNGYLDPEETWVFKAVAEALQGQYANKAYASAMNLAGKRTQDADKSYYYGVPFDFFMEYGDAPEGFIAYPDLGTIGTFPTGLDETFSSYIGHKTKDMFFGPMYDLESDGTEGTFNPGGATTVIDECFDDGDAGLLMPSAYFIDGQNSVVPCADTTNGALGTAMEVVSWGKSIDIHITNFSDQVAYVNVLFDWNQDGQWAFDPLTQVSDVPVPEHVLINFPVPAGFNGKLSQLTPPDVRIGPNDGYFWARFSVTPVQVAEHWTGEGVFTDGETEDYMLYVRPQPVIPLNSWSLIIIMLAMIITTFLIYKRK